MANKTLNTRISLKYDTYENWSTNNPVLLSGEVAIATVPSATGAVKQAPSTSLKLSNVVPSLIAAIAVVFVLTAPFANVSV